MLGGTVFVGRHIVEAAVARGWRVTLFTRGRHELPVFDGAVDYVCGDRRCHLDRLDDGTWDAVVDTCGYRPEDVAGSARRLASRAGCYVFVSSASVYPGVEGTWSEDATLTTAWEAQRDPNNPADYGPLKAACEEMVRRASGERCVIVRPGLIVGPCDPSDRFGYWPLRMAQGGRVLAPGSPADPVQLIDARDHAEFVLGLIDTGVMGTFNVASPAGTWTMGDVLLACTPPDSSCSVIWVDGRLLRLNGVRPWTELPLWLGVSPEGHAQIPTARAQAQGLRCRPLVETASATLEWERSRALPFPRPSQLPSSRERTLLAWYA